MTRYVRYSEFVKDPAKYADEARDSRTPLYVDRGKSSFVILLKSGNIDITIDGQSRR